MTHCIRAEIWSLCWSPSDSQLATCSEDQTTKIWHTDNWTWFVVNVLKYMYSSDCNSHFSNACCRIFYAVVFLSLSESSMQSNDSLWSYYGSD